MNFDHCHENVPNHFFRSEKQYKCPTVIGRLQIRGEKWIWDKYSIIYFTALLVRRTVESAADAYSFRLALWLDL